MGILTHLHSLSLPYPLHHLLAPALEVLRKVLVELLGEAFASADAVVVVNPQGVVGAVFLQVATEGAVVEVDSEPVVHHAAEGAEVLLHPTAAEQDGVER